MRISPESRGVAFCLLLLSVLCSAVQSLGSSVEVVGYAESSKIKNSNAFAGLRVTIDCKAAEAKGHFATRGSGEIDDTGKFSLNIPHDIVGDDGTLKEACYAQLHSAFGNPCPSGLETSKLIFLSKSGEKHVLGLKQNLKFSPEICVSKFFFPIPKIKKPCPPKIKLPPPVVIPKKPSPPKISHKPAVPIHKPSVPVHKPPMSPKKPSPPKTPKIADPPVHKPPKKVLPPVHKPPVVIPKKPSPPKTPVVVTPKKPCPPIFKFPPIVIPKKPCPPLPPIVIPKKPCPPLPPFPKLPPFGKWPPFPKHP